MTPPAARSVTINCNIRVSIEPRFVKVDQLSALGLRQFAVLDSLGYLATKTIVQKAPLIARASGGFAHGGAANHLLDQITFLVDMDLGFVGRAEQVVVIAHDFLVSAD